MYRVILIGDAGEISKEQKHLIPQAAGMVKNGKTTVVYLGDNIYPKAWAFPDQKN